MLSNTFCLLASAGVSSKLSFLMWVVYVVVRDWNHPKTVQSTLYPESGWLSRCKVTEMSWSIQGSELFLFVQCLVQTQRVVPTVLGSSMVILKCVCDTADLQEKCWELWALDLRSKKVSRCKCVNMK